MLLLLFVVACTDRRPDSTPTAKRVDSLELRRDSLATPVDTSTADERHEQAPLAPPTKSNPRGKYGVRTARVIYYNSRTQGNDTLYFDGYGAREAYYTATDHRARMPRRWVAMYARGVFSQFDLNTMGGDRVEREQPSGPILGFMPDIWNTTPELKRIYDAKSIDRRVVLGRSTEGYEFKYDGRRSIYLWEGIPLYHIWTDLRDPNAQPLILEAKEIDTSTAIPTARFTVPKGVVLTDKAVGQ